MKDEDSKGFKTQKWFSVCVVSIKQETKEHKRTKKRGKKRMNAPSSWRGVCFNTFEEVFDISPETNRMVRYYILIPQ